MKLVSFAK